MGPRTVAVNHPSTSRGPGGQRSFGGVEQKQHSRAARHIRSEVDDNPGFPGGIAVWCLGAPGQVSLNRYSGEEARAAGHPITARYVVRPLLHSTTARPQANILDCAWWAKPC